MGATRAAEDALERLDERRAAQLGERALAGAEHGEQRGELGVREARQAELGHPLGKAAYARQERRHEAL